MGLRAVAHDAALLHRLRAPSSSSRSIGRTPQSSAISTGLRSLPATIGTIHAPLEGAVVGERVEVLLVAAHGEVVELGLLDLPLGRDLLGGRRASRGPSRGRGRSCRAPSSRSRATRRAQSCSDRRGAGRCSCGRPRRRAARRRRRAAGSPPPSGCTRPRSRTPGRASARSCARARAGPRASGLRRTTPSAGR